MIYENACITVKPMMDIGGRLLVMRTKEYHEFGVLGAFHVRGGQGSNLKGRLLFFFEGL